MKLIKFLASLEKIIIILIILCLIPIIIFAYLPSPIPIPPQMQTQYSKILQMSQLTGFLTSYSKEQCDKTINVTMDDQYKIALHNQACMQRCSFESNCKVVRNNQNCNHPNSRFSVNSTIFCSDKSIENVYDFSRKEFQLNTSRPPLAAIYIRQDGSIGYQYYCLKDRKVCNEIKQHFGHSIKESLDENYERFQGTLWYLMCFGYLPLSIHMILVFLLDMFCKFNLRLTNSLMIIHQSLLGTAIIVLGIIFNLKNGELISSVQTLAQQCLITDINECSSLSLPFVDFKHTDGISDGFVIIMGVILAVEILGFIGILLINILMKKYYQLRELDPSLDGYQLHNL